MTAALALVAPSIRFHDSYRGFLTEFEATGEKLVPFVFGFEQATSMRFYPGSVIVPAAPACPVGLSHIPPTGSFMEAPTLWECRISGMNSRRRCAAKEAISGMAYVRLHDVLVSVRLSCVDPLPRQLGLGCITFF